MSGSLKLISQEARCDQSMELRMETCSGIADADVKALQALL